MTEAGVIAHVRLHKAGNPQRFVVSELTLMVKLSFCPSFVTLTVMQSLTIVRLEGKLDLCESQCTIFLQFLSTGSYTVGLGDMA